MGTIEWQLKVERKQARGCSWKFLEERHTLYEFGTIMYFFNKIFIFSSE
jgi:hypothetical protein